MVLPINITLLNWKLPLARGSSICLYTLSTLDVSLKKTKLHMEHGLNGTKPYKIPYKI